MLPNIVAPNFHSALTSRTPTLDLSTHWGVSLKFFTRNIGYSLKKKTDFLISAGQGYKYYMGYKTNDLQAWEMQNDVIECQPQS